jgi:hypothetical protein
VGTSVYTNIRQTSGQIHCVKISTSKSTNKPKKSIVSRQTRGQTGTTYRSVGKSAKRSMRVDTSDGSVDKSDREVGRHADMSTSGIDRQIGEQVPVGTNIRQTSGQTNCVEISTSKLTNKTKRSMVEGQIRDQWSIDRSDDRPADISAGRPVETSVDLQTDQRTNRLDE